VQWQWNYTYHEEASGEAGQEAHNEQYGTPVMSGIREAAVADYFYPADRGELSATVHRMLDEVKVQRGSAPKALIVPHAGYIYSGPVAATAYARLRPHRDEYERVVLLGPSHRVAVRGLATSGADVFRTPLGDVPVDHESLDRAAIAAPDLAVSEAAHGPEHSLEVHLPFLQIAIGTFSLLPIVVGDSDAEAVATVIDALWGGPETLIVVSSDLSHYLPYDAACARDRATCQAIENFDARRIGHADACGATPLGGLLMAARRRGMRITTLDLRNSGDTAGDKGQVVGYGSWMLLDLA
jgi:AmmeMemoRadiSam system protein B